MARHSGCDGLTTVQPWGSSRRSRTSNESDHGAAVTVVEARRRGKRAALILLTLAAAVAGCGGGSSVKTTSGPAHVIRLSADSTGALSFDTTQVTATPGTVKLIMGNPSPIAHGIAIDGGGVSSVGAVVGHGGASTVSLALKPGSYTFYCPVPGHRQAGMMGTLLVR